MASILIDGSVLEGGGQILRNSVSLSALLSKPVSIHQIRNNRTPPGLKNQHRTGIELAARISSAKLTGAKNGSREIEFVPGTINLPNHYTADTVTAGSITLLLQIALPLLLFAPKPVQASTLTLLGGTNATMAPQVDYTKHVFLPFLRRHFGIENVNLSIHKRGYFPRGGGEVSLRVVPFAGQDQKLRPCRLMQRGKVKWIAGVAHYAGLHAKVGKGMVAGATQRLAAAGFGLGKQRKTHNETTVEHPERNDIPVSISCTREPNNLTKGAGSGIVLWAELEGGGFIGGSAVGTKNVSPEEVGEEAAEELIKGLQEDGCVDEWLQDQIIIFMALADGQSEVRCGTAGLSLHTRTAIWVAERLTEAKFEIEEEESGHTIIRCQGIGYTMPRIPDTEKGTCQSS
ncbi:hypothetical protein M413DRAFT_438174 [Hebeloma cylindrosporum]|uniref:RNA 3'-terminal-phosphate cyclase (ATP) n=1 Tax=Hebeloma cylindrosporum TaxID=76867 RepID=A0A0C3CJY0_HEBCY|nr:hypothetical protein M413DRAFT_438174 [Hebeloma cylindrosporum h7]